MIHLKKKYGFIDDVTPTDCYFLEKARYTRSIPGLPDTTTLNYLKCNSSPEGIGLPYTTDITINQCVRIETIESSIVDFYPIDTLFNDEVENAIINNEGQVSRSIFDGELLAGRVTLTFSHC
jgi:hypothetical protein